MSEITTKPRSVVSADPAANAEASITVPSGSRWKIVSAHLTVVQGATQTPLPSLQVADAAGNVIGLFPGASAATSASTTSTFDWAEGLTLTAGAGATVNRAPIPRGLTVKAGWVISTSTAGKGATSRSTPRMAKTIVTFFSNASEHELVRQPRNDKPLPSGAGWINDTRGVKYKFKPAVDESGKMVGRLDVFVGQDKLQDHMGWLAPDEDDSIERDAPTALRAHREYGRDFWAMPVPAATLRSQLRQALADLNEESLVSLLAQEKAEHNRRDLVAEIDDSLSLVREQRASLAAAQAAADAERNAAWSEDDTNASLQKLCDVRGLTVVGTGANGLVVKADLVKALRESEAPVPA